MIIRTPADLDRLSAFPGLRARERCRLRLEGAAGLGLEATRIHEARLNRFHCACGCNEAALGMTLGLVSYVGWLMLRGASFGGLAWRDLTFGVAAAIAATAIGKAVGHLRAALAFRRAVGELRREWTASFLAGTVPLDEGPPAAIPTH